MCLVFVGFSGPILFRALGIMGTRAVTSAGDFTVCHVHVPPLLQVSRQEVLAPSWITGLHFHHDTRHRAFMASLCVFLCAWYIRVSVFGFNDIGVPPPSSTFPHILVPMPGPCVW